jgi:hypothetical protein
MTEGGGGGKCFSADAGADTHHHQHKSNCRNTPPDHTVYSCQTTQHNEPPWHSTNSREPTPA